MGNKLLPVVQDFIDFDTLMAEAHRNLSEYSGNVWSDTGEHDPGITLLQALCYNVSDLAYRTTLPLKDLLTPPPSEQQLNGGVFPEAFGPQRALTSAPITEDDYRRALLDLRNTEEDDGGFYVQNARLICEPEALRYRYWYNRISQNYSFIQPDVENEELTLRGNYFLYLQPTRWAEDNLEEAAAAIDAFLKDNRNLCESVSRVVWLLPQDIEINAQIELLDEVDQEDIPVILASIYTALDSYITPPTRRYSIDQLTAAGLDYEQVFEGPDLRYGWIPDLPPALPDIAEETRIDLAPMVNILLRIEGIKNIISLSAVRETIEGGNVEDPWTWVAQPGRYPRLWGSQPLFALSQGFYLVLMSHGNAYFASEADIRMSLPDVPLIHNVPVTMPYGRWRKPAVYHPATNRLPPCYDLLTAPTTPAQTQLHQYLLPFEQLISNACKQLSMLPNLLSFVRDNNDIVWGEQWPFSLPGVSNGVFKEYSESIKLYLDESSADMKKELSYINYLLGYFGGKLAERVYPRDPLLFLVSQQKFLAKFTELTYERDSIRVDEVTALHQRVAGRLGVGGLEVFAPNAPLDKLPFFILEHRGLMPILPDPKYNEYNSVLFVNEFTLDGVKYISLTLPPGEGGSLKVGQLIDVKVADEFEEGSPSTRIVRALMIFDLISGNGVISIRIRVSDSAQLQRDLEYFTDIDNKKAWKNCEVWLEDMYYPLAYGSENVHGPDITELKSTPQSPFPAMVKIGDVINLVYRGAPFTFAVTDSRDDTTEARVVSVDPISGKMWIEHISGPAFPEYDKERGYFWYFKSSAEGKDDRFSFAVSVVLDFDDLRVLANSSEPLVDWLKREILSEFPSSCSVLFHWLRHDAFVNFAATYSNWQAQGAALGDASYSLLRQMTLGCLPFTLLGIGSMYIATEEQRDLVVGDDGTDWNTEEIVRYNLFYIPE